ncbi:hypothetical protein FB451DRAFT_1573589 [Mycena latifolia]|nr:hypothetical protein FB451DRAFT_1573589 [Mycena latifolia]
MSVISADLQKGERLHPSVKFFFELTIALDANFRLQDCTVAEDDDDDELPELVPDNDIVFQPCCRHCRTCYPIALVRTKL